MKVPVSVSSDKSIMKKKLLYTRGGTGRSNQEITQMKKRAKLKECNTTSGSSPVRKFLKLKNNCGENFCYANFIVQMLDPVSYTHLTLPTICSV